MNDEDSPRTDVLDDDGAPHAARRHVPPPTITDDKERERSHPCKLPRPENE